MENKDEMENLIDKEDTTPYESYGILVWSFTAVVMLLGFESLLEFGIYYTLFFVVILTTTTYIAEVMITRKENSKHNINEMTGNQIKRNWVSAVSIIFSAPLILVFNQIDIIYYSYPIALFFIFFSLFSSGLFMNKFYFTQTGIFGLTTSFGMFGVFLYFGEDAFGNYEKYISATISGGAYLYIAVMIEGLRKS